LGYFPAGKASQDWFLLWSHHSWLVNFIFKIVTFL